MFSLAFIQSSPVYDVGALFAHSRGRAEGQGVIVGGGGGEVLLLVLDPGETETFRRGERVMEQIFCGSGQTLGHVREGGATVGHVLNVQIARAGCMNIDMAHATFTTFILTVGYI